MLLILLYLHIYNAIINLDFTLKEKVYDRTNIIEFYNIIKDIENNETVQKMKDFNHHCDVTCYEHCKHVAFANYIICKKLKLDYVSAARAGMLHDLFLYNWRGSRRRLEGLHAFVHPRIALKNAEKEIFFK